MAFERNDIVNKTRLAGELGEELMGFEHNDIVTVDVMNEAIAEGGGGGGGDFTTVKATVKNNSAVNFMVSMPNLFDAGEYGVRLVPTAAVDADGERVLDAILYKNAGVGYIDVLTFGNTITVSGDAEYDNGYIDFTGDFTITYSGG